MKLYNVLNAKDRPKNYKVFTEPSQTIPDQSLSIKEIMDRYAKGLPIGGGLTPIYEEDETSGINPRTLDLVDLQEMKMHNEQRIKNLQEKDKYEKNKEKNKKNSEKTVTDGEQSQP